MDKIKLLIALIVLFAVGGVYWYDCRIKDVCVQKPAPVVATPKPAPVEVVPTPPPLPQDIVIHFQTNKSDQSIEADATEHVKQFVAQAQPFLGQGHIQIAGHTDNTGGASFNRKLGEARAQYISSILTAEGIPADKINIVSYGVDKPAEDNSTPEGRQANRRAVASVINP